MSSITSSASRNPWITRGGGALFLALALGLLLSQGSVGAGYGTPAPVCAGYHQTCKASVSHVSTQPRTPRAGKGFTVTFTTASGGKYVIAAHRKGSAKSVVLSSGVVGTGTATVKRLGKKLGAHVYIVKVTLTSGSTKANATHAVTIAKS